MLNGYVEIENYVNNLDGEIAKGLLAENGVEALISTDDCGGMLPNLQLTRGVRLYVLPKDVENSRDLLKMLSTKPDRSDAENRPDSHWQCSHCGEELEPQFTDCWKCGTSREQVPVSPQDV